MASELAKRAATKARLSLTENELAEIIDAAIAEATPPQKTTAWLATSDEVAARLQSMVDSEPEPRFLNGSMFKSLPSLLADRETAKTLLARVEQVRARRDHLQSEAAKGNPFAQQVYGETACVLAILDGGKEQPQ